MPQSSSLENGSVKHDVIRNDGLVDVFIKSTIVPPGEPRSYVDEYGFHRIDLQRPTEKGEMIAYWDTSIFPRFAQLYVAVEQEQTEILDGHTFYFTSRQVDAYRWKPAAGSVAEWGINDPTDDNYDGLYFSTVDADGNDIGTTWANYNNTPRPRIWYSLDQWNSYYFFDPDNYSLTEEVCFVRKASALGLAVPPAGTRLDMKVGGLVPPTPVTTTGLGWAPVILSSSGSIDPFTGKPY